jgi:hypothetical protein
MIRRSRKLLGHRLQPAPLLGMICLDLEGGLTNHPEHGISAYNGRMSLDRTAYKTQSDAWHSTASGKQLYMPFPCRYRPFEAPKSMLNDSAVLESVVNAYYNGYGTPFRPAIEVFDVCIVTDLRFQGGNASSTMEEVQFLQENGHSVALVHCPIDRRLKTPANDRYSKLKRFTYDASTIGQTKCKELIVRHPSVACSSSYQTLRNQIDARRVHFVVNNSNLRIDGTAVYSISDLVRIAQDTKAEHVELCPISPIMRRQLIASGALKGRGVSLSATDWNPTFNFVTHRVEPRRWRPGHVVIGRHGRDGPEKWLESADLLRRAYPAGDGFTIKVLGGADTARKILGSFPDNWNVHPFGAMDPMQFLDEIDVFAYFPNTGLDEGFGRTVVEALMRGVVCLLPLNFEETFGDLAIYARPNDVEQICARLAETPDLRMDFVRCTSAIAAGKFSNEVIDDRLQIDRPAGSRPRRQDATALTAELATYKRWVETGSEGSGE